MQSRFFQAMNSSSTGNAHDNPTDPNWVIAAFAFGMSPLGCYMIYKWYECFKYFCQPQYEDDSESDDDMHMLA